MAIKQITVGGTTHDLKALNATNNDTADFVVRDLKYGTADPSGGSAGQVYLQYDADITSNPYVYAEDTSGDAQSVIDRYYTKSEVDAIIARVSALETKTTYYNYAWSGTTTSEVVTTFSVQGTGFVMVTGYIQANASTDNYGLLDGIIFKSDNSGSSYYQIARSEWRKHGSGYMLGPAALVSTATSATNNTRLKVEFHRSFDNSHSWRIEMLSVGCKITKL